MTIFWNRPFVSTTIQPVMKIATSRIHDISHWLSTNNKHVKIGLAIILPSVALLLTATPITNKLAQAWRRATRRPSPEKKAIRPETVEQSKNDKPPKLPKKSYGQLSPGKRVARPERSEHGTNDKSPELPKKPSEQLLSKKRGAHPERSEHVNKIDNTVYNNENNGSSSTGSPSSPKKSYAAAAAAPTATPIVEPLSPFTPDTASINSESSSEHSQKRKFRLGQNIKKRWQNRPFGHGSSESPLSP